MASAYHWFGESLEVLHCTTHSHVGVGTTDERIAVPFGSVDSHGSRNIESRKRLAQDVRVHVDETLIRQRLDVDGVLANHKEVQVIVHSSVNFKSVHDLGKALILESRTLIL